MLATLTDAPFDDPAWVFEDKYDGFRMVASIEAGRVTLYSRNGKIISHSYLEVAQALERVKRSTAKASRAFSCSRTRSVMMPSCSIASLI
jgi:ATP-dependent DNA ligase